MFSSSPSRSDTQSSAARPMSFTVSVLSNALMPLSNSPPAGYRIKAMQHTSSKPAFAPPTSTSRPCRCVYSQCGSEELATAAVATYDACQRNGSPMVMTEARFIENAEPSGNTGLGWEAKIAIIAGVFSIILVVPTTLLAIVELPITAREPTACHLSHAYYAPGDVSPGLVNRCQVQQHLRYHSGHSPR